MRWMAAFLVILALLSGCATQSRDAHRPVPATPSEVTQSTAWQPSTLAELLERDDFDLAEALLVFSETYYPEFSGRGRHDADVPAKLARFERYGDNLRREVQRARTPRMRLRALTDFVHHELGLRFDPADAQGMNPENLFFDRVLQNRYGYCVSLSMAYLVFGRLAGLDVQPIRIPGHFAVVYADAERDGIPFRVIIETTDFGTTRDELHYYTRHRFSATSVENGVYLTPITDREIFGTFYNNLAGLTFLRGDRRLAVERYTRALELSPNNAETLYNRAIVQRRLNQPQPALRDLNEALRLDPNFALALIARAGLFWENNERDLARRDLADAMRKRPDWPEPHMLDGQFLMEAGDLDAARQAFHKALEVSPGYNSAHIALAELEQKAGNHAKAREHLQAAGHG
jgi:regulator of sirC expression with transglutaminase-like and TPR domain